MTRDAPPTGGWLAPFAVFGMALAYYGLFVRYGFNVDDEGTLLAEFYRAARGELPYRDFHMGYTPGGHYYHALLLRLFGLSVIPLRWSLALGHATVATLLFALGRRVMPVSFAVLASLVYCAIMPFYPGEFASFNIPYPAWYTVLFGIVGFWALVRGIETGGLAWFALSGVTAGLCFSFKPNVGLFQVAGAGLVFLLLLEPPAGRGARLQGAAWWLLAIGVLGGLAVVFGPSVRWRDAAIYLVPIFVVVLVAMARRLAGRSGDAPTGPGLFGAGITYFAALLAVVVPWVLLFVRLLGRARFARQVFFIGAGFESYYYVPFHYAGRWDALLLIVLAALTTVGLVQRARLIPTWALPSAAALAAVATALALRGADMPEGLHPAVVSRSEDLIFTVTLVVHWVALALLVPTLWRSTRVPTERVTLALLVGAFTTFLQLYPRSDFMHVIAAVPLTLVLGAMLAARYAAWFDATPAFGRIVRLAIVGGVVAFVGIRITPNLRAVVTWEHGVARRPLTTLAVGPAPITLEWGRAPRFRAIEGVVDYIRANTEPTEAIFSFPAIELLCFFADRPQATRRGHFFPGWPGHDVEAEVVSDLRRAPPRLAVVLHGHQLFFATGPAYYYALREFVQAHYRQVATFGEYAVLVRRDVPDAELRTPPPPAARAELEERYGERLRGLADERLAALQDLVEERLDYPWEPVAALLDDGDARVRTAAVRALGYATDPAVAAPLARALLQNAVPPELRLMTFRRLLATADTRTIRSIVEMLPTLFEPLERDLALGTLYAIAHKHALASYWFGAPAVSKVTLGRLPGARDLRRVLASPDQDLRLRMFLAWMLPAVEGARAVPALNVALGTDYPPMRSAAASGLMRLDVRQPGLDLLELVLPLVARDPTFAPSIALALYRRDPVAARRPLARALAKATPLEEEALAWIVSATGDRHFRVPLQRLLASPDRGIRRAGLAGLERIADPRTRPAILRALSDPDYEVRDAAVRALAALPPA